MHWGLWLHQAIIGLAVLHHLQIALLAPVEMIVLNHGAVALMTHGAEVIALHHGIKMALVLILIVFWATKDYDNLPRIAFGLVLFCAVGLLI